MRQAQLAPQGSVLNGPSEADGFIREGSSAPSSADESWLSQLLAGSAQCHPPRHPSSTRRPVSVLLPVNTEAKRRCANGSRRSACLAERVMYLTDEIFLYRVVDRLVTEAGEVADLEDCYWLDVVRVPAHELQERGLRVVRPEGSGPS